MGDPKEMVTSFISPLLYEMGPRNDKGFGVKHRWPSALATLASPCQPCPFPSEASRKPSPHSHSRTGSRLPSGISECQCRLVWTLPPCQEGRGHRAAPRTGVVSPPEDGV